MQFSFKFSRATLISWKQEVVWKFWWHFAFFNFQFCLLGHIFSPKFQRIWALGRSKVKSGFPQNKHFQCDVTKMRFSGKNAPGLFSFSVFLHGFTWLYWDQKRFKPLYAPGESNCSGRTVISETPLPQHTFLSMHHPLWVCTKWTVP